MSVIQTASSIVFTIIGTVSFVFTAICVYLMYADPASLEIFMNTCQMLLNDARQLIRNL